MEISSTTRDAAAKVVATAVKSFNKLHGDKLAYLAAEIRTAMLLQHVMNPATLADLRTEKTSADAAEWMLALYAAVVAA